MQQIFPQRFFRSEFQFEISLKNIIDFKGRNVFHATITYLSYSPSISTFYWNFSMHKNISIFPSYLHP